MVVVRVGENVRLDAVVLAEDVFSGPARAVGRVGVPC